MKVAKDTVVVMNYVLKDKETGDVIDRSDFHGEPIAFLVGANNIIPGLEERMIGMEEGEKKTIEVPSKEAYGEWDENLVQKVPREYFKNIPHLEKGMPIQGQTEDGHILEMVIIDFDENEVTVDMNHPLAGRDLVFEIEVVKVREATEEEIEHGHVHHD